jgi:hypothetical protein
MEKVRFSFLFNHFEHSTEEYITRKMETFADGYRRVTNRERKKQLIKKLLRHFSMSYKSKLPEERNEKIRTLNRVKTKYPSIVVSLAFY